MEINNFREWFERGEDPLADMTDASDINSVAGVLKLYLRELREPLFPIIYFEQFMDLARTFLVISLFSDNKYCVCRIRIQEGVHSENARTHKQPPTPRHGRHEISFRIFEPVSV